jgi:hypothetical protein
MTHPAASPTLQILRLMVGDKSLDLINFYHHVENNMPDLRSLLLIQPDLQSDTPVVVAGDFNTHSRLWSMADTPPCPWSDTIEDWMADNGLNLLSPPHIPTRHGEHGQKDTVIDLVLWNLAAAWADQFYFNRMSFPDSLSSDHAALVFSWAPALYIPPAPSNPTPRWVIHDSMEDVWRGRFADVVPETIVHTDPHDVATTLLQTIVDTNDWCFDCARPLPLGRGARWWNEGCSGALHLLQEALPTDRPHAFQCMRHAIRIAKRDWAESVLLKPPTMLTNEACGLLPSGAKGGPHPSSPPSSLKAAPPLTMPRCQPLSGSSFFRPPLPTSTQPSWTTLTQSPPPYGTPSVDEVQRCLAGTSNSSTPGLSRVPYKFIKWAFASRPQVFTHLFNLCLPRVPTPGRRQRLLSYPNPPALTTPPQSLLAHSPSRMPWKAS